MRDVYLNVRRTYVSSNNRAEKRKITGLETYFFRHELAIRSSALLIRIITTAVDTVYNDTMFRPHLKFLLMLIRHILFSTEVIFKFYDYHFSLIKITSFFFYQGREKKFKKQKV